MYNIGLFTSSRADFGILKNIAKKLEKSPKYKLKIFIAGSHLSKNFGSTINEIQRENFTKLIRCKNLVFSKNQVDIMKSTNKLSKIFLNQLNKNKIDLMIILGDRYELIPVSTICFLKKIKIIHLHGGEITLGAIDNKIRNSVSFLSDYHFVATKKSKKRLEKFGIKKKSIYCLGAPGLEGINEKLEKKKYLENKFKFKFKTYNILVSLHPETLSNQSIKFLQVFLNSIKKFPKINFIFSSPGADTDGYKMKVKIVEYSKKYSNCYFFNSLGHKEYLSFIKYSNIVMGNSSSGIIEAPSLNRLSIDLGIRQLGRERANSVKNIPFNQKKIERMIKYYINKKINNSQFKNPYYLYKKPSLEFLKKIKECL